MNRAELDVRSLRWTLAFALLAAVLAAAQRLTSPFLNFTMIGALGLWSGARLRPRLGLVLPLVVWCLTDVYLWRVRGYPPFNPFVAVSFLLNALLGYLLLRRNASVSRIGSVCVLGSVQFFLLTNFSVWLKSATDAAHRVPEGRAYIVDTVGGKYDYPTIRYAANAEGLLACYAVALPFYGKDVAGNAVPAPLGCLGNALLADLLFAGLLFGGHALLLSLIRRRAVARRDAS